MSWKVTTDGTKGSTIPVSPPLASSPTSTSRLQSKHKAYLARQFDLVMLVDNRPGGELAQLGRASHSTPTDGEEKGQGVEQGQAGAVPETA